MRNVIYINIICTYFNIITYASKQSCHGAIVSIINTFGRWNIIIFLIENSHVCNIFYPFQMKCQKIDKKIKLIIQNIREIFRKIEQQSLIKNVEIDWTQMLDFLLKIFKNHLPTVDNDVN